VCHYITYFSVKKEISKKPKNKQKEISNMFKYIIGAISILTSSRDVAINIKLVYKRN
jgi:hypothetical protein